MNYDAIVVGAGPAGCAAAYDLARAGKRVLLLERQKFPREKACAGALTMKTIRALRYPIASVIRNFVHCIAVGTMAEQWALLEGDQPLCAMTVRQEFDEYCLGQTLKTGTEFRFVKTIFGVAQSMSNVSLSTSEGIFNGSFLVGADGANSQIRRICAFPIPRIRGFALEACLELPERLPVMRLDFGVVRSGYGWIFPKNDHINVGLYTCSHSGPFGRRELQQYARENIGSASINRIVGQYIGCDTHETPPARGRVLLVGDAGGFSDALTGEGIYQAITTGQVAARTILQHFTDPSAIERDYSAELFPLRADLLLRRQVARLLYSNFGYAKAALSLSCVRKAFSRIYALGGGFITSMSRALGSLSIVPSLREFR